MRPSRSVSRSSFTRPLVSKTATEERKGQGRAVEDRRARQGSVMEVPVDPKHWLLQSLRLQDRELQELFDQVCSITVSEIRVSEIELARTLYCETEICEVSVCADGRCARDERI